METPSCLKTFLCTCEWRRVMLTARNEQEKKSNHILAFLIAICGHITSSYSVLWYSRTHYCPHSILKPLCRPKMMQASHKQREVVDIERVHFAESH